MYHRFKLIAVSVSAGLACLLSSHLVFAEVAIIVNAENAVNNLTTKQVRAIFLKKKRFFPNGSPVIPVDQPEGSVVRAEFNKKVLRKRANQLNAYWSKLIFTGKAQPPEVIGDDMAVKEWVAETPNAIGFVDVNVLDNSVKVLLRIP